MRVCGAKRRPEIRREQPSEHRPFRPLPSAARSCVRCSDASCDENSLRRQEFCSPSASSRVTLARPRVRRAASRAIGQLVAVNRQRSSRRSLLGAPTVASARHTLSSRDDATSNCCVLNANGWQAFRVKLLYTTDSHSPPRSDNPNMRYLRGARKKTKGAPTSIRRHSRVIDLQRHAARTATAVERATAHVHSHVRGCRWVISPHTTHARAQARPMATPVERGVSE